MYNEMIEDWEFNHLGVYNYKNPHPVNRMQMYLDFIVENHKQIDGDLCEVGVYRGGTLLAVAMLLRDIGSDKKVYGFDSFSGFPPVLHENDNAKKFDLLLKENRITKEHYYKCQKRLKHRQVLGEKAIDSGGLIVSISGNFEKTSKELVERKIKFLELDNVVLVEGFFDETMTDKSASAILNDTTFMGAWIDCDLYSSYKTSLPFVWKRLSKGGYIHLDEYYSLKYPGARIATDEFFADKPDKPQMHRLRNMDFERWFVRKIYSA